MRVRENSKVFWTNRQMKITQQGPALLHPQGFGLHPGNQISFQQL